MPRSPACVTSPARTRAVAFHLGRLALAIQAPTLRILIWADCSALVSSILLYISSSAWLWARRSLHRDIVVNWMYFIFPGSRSELSRTGIFSSESRFDGSLPNVVGMLRRMLRVWVGTERIVSNSECRRDEAMY